MISVSPLARQRELNHNASGWGFGPQIITTNMILLSSPQHPC